MKRFGLWLAIGWATVGVIDMTVAPGKSMAAPLVDSAIAQSSTPSRTPATPTTTAPVTIRSLPPVCAMLEIRAGQAVLLDASMFPVEEVIRQFIFARQYQPALEFLQRLPSDAPDVDPSLIMSGLKLLAQPVASYGTAAERAAIRDYGLQFAKTSEESIWGQASNLRDLAKLYLTANQQEDAIALAKAAMRLVNTIPTENPIREPEQERLIELFTNEGLVEAALQVVDVSQDDLFRVAFRYQQANYAAQQGKSEQAQTLYQQALTLAQTRLPDALKAEWLMTLATPLHIPQAQLQQWVTEVAAIIPTVPDRSYQPTLMLRLAEQQQQLGQAEDAKRQVQAAIAIAQTLAKEPNSEFVLIYLVRQALEAHQLDAANQMTALAVKVTRDRDRLHEGLSRDYAATGYFDQALQQIDLIKTATVKEAARVNVILSALELSRFDVALPLIQRSNDPFIQQRAIAGLMARYLETGKQAEALQLASQPGNFDSLLLVADRFSKRQGVQYPARPDLVNWVLDQATAMANRIPNVTMRQERIAIIASKAAYLLQFDRAMTLAATLPPQAQADVYDQISRNVWQGMEQSEASMRQFVTTLPAAPFKLQVIQQMAGHYTMRGQKTAALPLLDEATQLMQQLSLNDVSNLERLARAYWMLAEPGKALQLVETHNLLTREPEGPIQRIELAIQAGKTAQAQQLLATLRQQVEARTVAPSPQGATNAAIATQVKWLAQLATQYANLGDRDQAMQLLTQAVERQKALTGSQAVRDRGEALREIVTGYARLIARYAEAGQGDRANSVLAQARLLTREMPSLTADSATALLQCLQSNYALSN